MAFAKLPAVGTKHHRPQTCTVRPGLGPDFWAAGRQSVLKELGGCQSDLQLEPLGVLDRHEGTHTCVWGGGGGSKDPIKVKNMLLCASFLG